MSKKPIVVIEHCEQELGPWLFLEYRHASLIYGKEHLLFSNVPPKYHRLLSRYGRVSVESFVEYVRSGRVDPERVVVLDPRAKEPLEYRDLVSSDYVVVGGILGDHPPRGRTREIITSRMPPGVRVRNIGEGQYSIDGSVYYVHYLWVNKGLEGFTYVDGVYVETEQGYVYLPYRYPLVNGKPLLAEGLEHYLKYRRIRDDIWREITSHSTTSNRT